MAGLLKFLHFPRRLWRKLRTANAIERCFVEIRRHTQPMFRFLNVASIARIIDPTFNGHNRRQERRNRTHAGICCREFA